MSSDKHNCAKNCFFVHFGKAAGSYLNAYLVREVFVKNDFIEKYKPHFYNNWWARQFPKGEGDFLFKSFSEEPRDFNKSELLEISKKSKDNLKFVTCHHNNVDDDTVDFFNSKDWLTFMFIRDPRDVICSLYFFSIKIKAKHGVSALGREGALAGNFYTEEDFQEPDWDDPDLDTFVNRVITKPEYFRFWKTPSYIDKLDFVKEFNEKNFSIFLRQAYNHDYQKAAISEKNTSYNKGYKHYLDKGLISEENNLKLLNHKDYINFNRYLDEK